MSSSPPRAANVSSRLMTELKKLAPDATILPPVPELPLFLAVLARAGVFISGDTGPLHFAAGLGVPTISLFGPSSPAQWAPIGERHQVLTGSSCACDGNLSVCQKASHCLAAISPEQVFTCLQTVLAESTLRDKSPWIICAPAVPAIFRECRRSRRC